MTMSQIFNAHRTVCTQGTYMGEEGEGFGWGEFSVYGDFSVATRGRLQGYTAPCRIEVFDDNARLLKAQDGEYYLFVPKDTMAKIGTGTYPLDHEFGLTASEAILYGLARVVEEG